MICLALKLTVLTSDSQRLKKTNVLFWKRVCNSTVVDFADLNSE